MDNTTISNLKQGKNLNKLNVVSACLGIHIPSRVSARMLKLSELPMDSDPPRKTREENDTFQNLFCFFFGGWFFETHDELIEENYENLIHQPPLSLFTTIIFLKKIEEICPFFFGSKL